jgi:hypothetical protein
MGTPLCTGHATDNVAIHKSASLGRIAICMIEIRGVMFLRMPGRPDLRFVDGDPIGSAVVQNATGCCAGG